VLRKHPLVEGGDTWIWVTTATAFCALASRVQLFAAAAFTCFCSQNLARLLPFLAATSTQPV
jgi:uncharacterized membrane protein